MFLGGANYSMATFNCSLDRQNIPHKHKRSRGASNCAKARTSHQLGSPHGDPGYMAWDFFGGGLSLEPLIWFMTP